MTKTRASSSIQLLMVASLSVLQSCDGFAPTSAIVTKIVAHPGQGPGASASSPAARGTRLPHSWHSVPDAHRPPRLPQSTEIFESSDDAEASAPSDEVDAPAVSLPPSEKRSILSKIKSAFSDKNESGLTGRERLSKLGLSALLSYGFVSNMSYAVTLSLSWFIHSKRTGLSPLAEGQWKPFLAVYGGFYVFNNIIRPLRFGASVLVAKYFEQFVKFIQRKSHLSRKWAIGVVVFVANVCGTFAAMGLGVSIASTAAGVPIFPRKL